MIEVKQNKQKRLRQWAKEYRLAEIELHRIEKRMSELLLEGNDIIEDREHGFTRAYGRKTIASVVIKELAARD